ncbi:hypothetical protein DRO64_08215 [Candidatus Bathyarchaeota archaeon]|nr:MAG: hypothetical protein DRO64_08215 [Candidatus Bathyarchaeota archaeon]
MIMKSQAKVLTLTFILLLFLASFQVEIRPAKCISVEMKVNRVVWGNNIDNPIEAHPGDKRVPLTVEVQNLSPNRTIKGVSAVLKLQNSPFTDIYGKLEATATGRLAVGEAIRPADEIQPKSFFTLTFTLNIDDDAVPGTYIQPMTINYWVKSKNEYVEGLPQNLSVKIVISKIESNIRVNVSPRVIVEGEYVRVTGSINPAPKNATITLAYIGPKRAVNRKVKVNIDGTFSDSFKPDINGTWNLNASWPGNVRYKGSWASVSFEVRPIASISIITSSNRIFGGSDNEFTVTIINDGKIPISALDASLYLPYPLVVHGRESWRIECLNTGDNSSIKFVIFAPDSSIGSTYTGKFEVNYRDIYGEKHSKRFTLGLIVVGRVELILYEESIRPQPVCNGSKFKFSAALLNRGTVSAMHVNVSIWPSSILHLTSESKTYIGEIEENSQSPFTVEARVREDVSNGTYPITIRISYRDDQHVDREFNVTFPLEVIAVKSARMSNVKKSIFPLYLEDILTPIIVLAASIIITLLYRRRIIQREKSGLMEEGR